MDISRELIRARLKADVAARVAHLTGPELRQLCAELIVEHEVQHETQREVQRELPREATNGSRPTPIAKGSIKVLTAKAMPVERFQRTTDTLVPEKLAKGTRTDQLLAYLERSRAAGIPAIALAVYGVADAKAKDRVRSMLHSLKAQGRVAQSATKGKWRLPIKRTRGEAEA